MTYIAQINDIDMEKAVESFDGMELNFKDPSKNNKISLGGVGYFPFQNTFFPNPLKKPIYPKAISTIINPFEFLSTDKKTGLKTAINVTKGIYITHNT